jgi:hypothetical protein
LEEERKQREEEARQSALEEARQMPQGINFTLDDDIDDRFADAINSADDIKVRCDRMALRPTQTLAMSRLCSAAWLVSTVWCV